MIAEFPVHLGVKLSTDLRATLGALAAREHTTVSAVVRRLIDQEAKRNIHQSCDLSNEAVGV